MSPLLDGQTAVVTGGGRGLGRATAEVMAALGAHVVVASRNAPELDEVVLAIKKAGGRALAYAADVADERQVQELVFNTERWVGPPTVLVNNAGVVDPIAPLARTDATSWLRHLAINVGGPYLATRAVLPGMLERGYGRIVSISSGAATRPYPGWTAYGAGKAGLEQLMRTLAAEIEGTGVTACVLRPGRVDTQLQERVRRASPDDFPEVEDFRETQRQGGLRDPQRVARVVAYLASPRAARNGQIVELDEALEREAAQAVGG
ncbi:MAG TPA: SDR family oxidoreductase [Candidatus Limnocylindria bacterium]|nr:SDR family oxidoreductase [Candidatus Limnocylindria bacterium]